MGCCDGYCSKCGAMQKIVLGAVVLANYWWNLLDWWLLVGALLVLGGVIKLVMPSCPCNKGMCCGEEMPKAAPKKKK
jgi:hypothetical protein